MTKYHSIASRRGCPSHRMGGALCAAILLTVVLNPAFAQGPWTLRQCIDHALSHNLTVRQQSNALEQRELQLSTARNSRLPDLSVSAGQNFSFGRGLTAENTYTNTNTSSTSFSLSTSVPLFTGFSIPNQIRLSQLHLQAATQDLEKARNDMSVQVAQAYVQVLYDQELCGVAWRQVGIDSVQVARLEALLQQGKTSRSELSQQQATLAQSRLTATQAESNRRLSLLTLAQLLELPTTENFAVVSPEFPDSMAVNPLPTPDLIYAEAVQQRPEVQSEQLRLHAADKSILIARSALYPQLSLSAGLGSNYYTTSGYDADAFGRQLHNNFSQYVGLNLSIPIFNRFQTRNNVRSARIDRNNQQLQVEQVQKQLMKEIQQVYYNAVAARQKVASCLEARRSYEDAFALMQAKYEQGKATATEFNEAKNGYMKAESDLTQARYECLYQQALLLFYRGEPLDLL